VIGSHPSRLRRSAYLSVSSLALLATSAALLAASSAWSQDNPAPAASGAPQPAAPVARPDAPAVAVAPAPQPDPAAPAPNQAQAPLQSSVPEGNVLPETRVVAPIERPRRRAPPAPRVATARPPAAASAPKLSPEQAQAAAVSKQNQTFDAARQTILAPTGANTYQITSESVASRPQGSNASLDKVLLAAPGVTQDSAAGGDLHVRNEHANVQYRINGIMLPDGVGAFGQILDTGIVGSLALLTGALPVQYGLRTAGVVDIQTKSSAFGNSGTVSVYGGSRGTITPSFEYGGTVGNTQYYVTGRYFGSDIGLENPTPAFGAIHDHTDQGKGFAYASTVIDPTLRLTFMSGISDSRYQIPNNPGQTPAFTAFGVSNFASSQLREAQTEFNQFNILALQYSHEGLDIQTSYFNRTSTVHFQPDVIGDLVFNGVASDIYRRSFINGIQSDGSYRLSDSHTLRFGMTASVEQGFVSNSSIVLPVDADGNAFDAPFPVVDQSRKTGALFGAYLGDEWKINNQLTLSTGLRFDQMWQYTDANQFSPRVSLSYKPFEDTTFHAGYARYFTPPSLVLSAPTNLGLLTPPNAPANTQTPGVNVADPVQPERSHYFDIGVTQKISAIPGLEVGVDAYYKIATDLLDDGQFGAAYVLTAFNYAKGENEGVEFKATYKNGNFNAYGNIAIAKQIATTVVSNQFLFDPDELAFINSHYVYTDHAQIVSGSAGASYLWNGTRFSADLLFGSGLRSGFANTDVLPWYSQVNVGVSHEFKWSDGTKPTTVRFDVVNLFDEVYAIRDGSGIGVFAPQYGPRRGFFAGVSQKF
jgi:outer membrane receptor protein involved in Fe transport